MIAICSACTVLFNGCVVGLLCARGKLSSLFLDRPWILGACCILNHRWHLGMLSPCAALSFGGSWHCAGLSTVQNWFSCIENSCLHLPESSGCWQIFFWGRAPWKQTIAWISPSSDSVPFCWACNHAVVLLSCGVCTQTGALGPFITTVYGS